MRTALHSKRIGSTAMTLVEVLVSMGIMGIVFTGILASLVQTRRLAAEAVAVNCAATIVQGYIEQLKNMPLQQFINSNPTDPQFNPNLTSSFTLPTMKDPTSSITLQTTPSGVAASTMLNATPGITPRPVNSGDPAIVDNLQTFDMDSRIVSGTTTWNTIWTGANTSQAYPSTTPGNADLRMNFWIQISDLTPNSPSKYKAYGILLVYTWQYTDGGRIKYFKDSVRTIRSAVQTF